MRQDVGKMIGHHDLEHCFIKFADCQWLNAVSDIFECEAELQNLLNIYRQKNGGLERI